MEQHSKIKSSTGLAPAAIVSDTTTVGLTIDRQGFVDLEFHIASGVLTDGAYACQLFAGDASNMSDEAQVTAAGDLIGTVPSFALSEDATVKKVGYRGTKRYVRLKVVSTAVTSGGLVSALAVQARPNHVPAGGIA